MRYQKGRKGVMAAFVVAMALAVAACGLFDEQPTGPSQEQNVTVIINATPAPTPAPSASPTANPSPGSTVISEVRVPLVGENCPAGTPPANAQRTLRVGCSGFITCTPFVRGADGTLRLATEAEHGPAPRAFGVTSGTGGTFTAWPANGFNADFRASAAGAFTITCEVNGLPEPNRPDSNKGTLQLTVIP